MNKNEMWVGQRVSVIDTFDNKDMKGYTGTVICLGVDGYEVGVEFDEWTCFEGHTLGGKIASGRGRYGRANELVNADETPDISVSYDDIFT